ncbi:hypothetical protein TNCV_1120581 [Trichonephila clavipes]|uniref:Uncharacterized protein n=1 Tax=Trichonephila clavipes TaxID=2585209 RepID=A0A8X6VNX8_TRICX|nr:hypothetical protein TNCV_1120581 [Trichonephila clavipes]
MHQATRMTPELAPHFFKLSRRRNCITLVLHTWGCGGPMVKVSDPGRHVMSSSPVPLKTRRAVERCTLNLSRGQTSSCWCGMVGMRGW